MQIVTDTNHVDKLFTGEERHFTIKPTRASFELLSSGLYSDKFLAIVRELACNAYDAHVAAGREEVPFEITLPTYYEPELRIRDDGIGLSHEDVLTVYSTYFDSTKQTSNLMIGTHGLGSKSPFSYTSTFTIEARHNNTKRLYSCFKDDDGFPSIAFLHEEPTDEHNGVTVTIPVKSDDAYKFVEAAKKALMYFKRLPVVKNSYNDNFTPHSVEYILTGNNWGLRTENLTSGYMNKARVIQGHVAYPLSSTILREAVPTMSPAAIILSQSTLDIMVEMGKANVAASREALSYDKRTIDHLVDRLEKIVAEITSNIQKQFDNCQTDWEAAQLYHELVHERDSNLKQFFKTVINQNKVTRNGHPITDTIIVDTTGLRNFICQLYTKGRKRKPAQPTGSPLQGIHYAEIPITSNTVVLIDYRSTNRTIGYNNYISSLSGNFVRLLVLRPTHTKTYNEQEVMDFLNILKPRQVVWAKDLIQWFPQTAKPTAKKRTKSEKLKWTGKSKNALFSRLCWETVTVDMEDGGFYVPIHRFAPNVTLYTFENILLVATRLGMIEENTPVYGFNQPEIDFISKQDWEWINLFDHVQSLLDNKQLLDKLLTLIKIDELMSNISPELSHFFTVQQHDQYVSLLPDCEIKSFIMDIREKHINRLSTLPSSTVLCILHWIKFNVSDTTEYVTQWRQLLNKYPLLTYTKVYNTSEYKSFIESTVEYIQAIENMPQLI